MATAGHNDGIRVLDDFACAAIPAADLPAPNSAGRGVNTGVGVRIAGERIKRTEFIQTERYVVAIEVEMMVPPDDQSEPCFESETVRFLKEVKERAQHGELTWLKQHGKVYVAVGIQRVTDFRTDAEKQAAQARFEQHFGSVNMGTPTGTENDAIDADLAREYGENHEDT